MPSVIRSTIESTVDNVVKDIKIQMDENLELMIRGTDDEHKEKILADPRLLPTKPISLVQSMDFVHHVSSR